MATEIGFFQRHHTRRVRDYEALPLLLNDGGVTREEDDTQVTLGVEIPPAAWEPRDVDAGPGWTDSPILPRRFIDGKDVGSTVAWLQSEEGYPVPVRLSQIGAVALRVVDGELRREEEVPLERVVTMIVDLFPWEEIEELAIDLHNHGFRLLLSEKPRDSENPENRDLLFDFERMRRTTQGRSTDEMIRLERQTLARASDVATLVDGRLDPRAGAFDVDTTPVIGMIKTHREPYLHRQGWRVFFSLQPGQRTPAFLLQGGKLKVDVVTWFLKLDGERGELPNWGVVRLELAKAYFEQQLGGDWSVLDRLSRLIRAYRCRDTSYGRAPVSLQPIVRAEELLGALFTPNEALAHQFYRLAGL